MSEELEPRHYSDRELTLSAISLTFQRARSVQRELTGTPSFARPDPGPGRADETTATAVAADSDLEDTANGNGNGDGGRPLQLDTSEEQELPNPIVTDANFRHYLDQATANQAAGLGRIRGRGADQALYNAAMVHALHQLDHRTRLQQRTISRLEAELADARRALAALESNELKAP